MRKYLIHDVLSKRVRLADRINSQDTRLIFQEAYKQMLLRLVVEDPPIFCLNNIQKYLTASSLPWYQNILDYVKSTSPSNSQCYENPCSSPPPLGFFENLNHPLARFNREAVWMETTEAPLIPAGKYSPATGWMIYRETKNITPSLVFVEFNRYANRQVEMSSITSVSLDELDRIAPLNTPGLIESWCTESNMATYHLHLNAVPRLHLPLFALNILRTKDGFSMPIEEQGRRQLVSRIGIQNETGPYFFEVGPKMKHFVRGHIRVYTARQCAPLTVWVHSHTRGNRRPMQPGQHRRGSIYPAVDENANALRCTDHR